MSKYAEADYMYPDRDKKNRIETKESDMLAEIVLFPAA